MSIMKWSPILHKVAAVSGVVGLLALVMWWIALLREGTTSPFSAEHLYDDAIALFLLSIAFGIGTLIHQRKERQQQ